MKVEAVKDGTIEHLHGFELETVKERAHLLPESFLGAGLFDNGLEKGATELLGLIDEEHLREDPPRHQGPANAGTRGIKVCQGSFICILTGPAFFVLTPYTLAD